MAHFSLKNKNILITGATSGIGSACGKLCSELGANLILLGRNKERLVEILNNLVPNNHSAISCDLMNTEDIERSIENSLVKYDKIDGFIHSAGVDITLPLNSLREKDFQSTFTINVFSGFEIARIISKKQFRPVDGASFIFIASVMGLVGESAKIGYSASKGAMISGCRSMAIELAPKKIRVNCVSPAIVCTDLVAKLFSKLPENSVENIKSKHPLGFGTPKDIANACVFLLSNEAKWITGSNLVIDGGYSCQ